MSPRLPPPGSVTITVRDEKGRVVTVRAPKCYEWTLDSEGRFGPVKLKALVHRTIDEPMHRTDDDPDADVQRLTAEVADLRRRLAVSEEDRGRLAARCRELYEEAR